MLELARRIVPESNILEQTVRHIPSENKPVGIRSTQRKPAVDVFDDDAIIARINAGVERVAAQQATPPIEEHFT